MQDQLSFICTHYTYKTVTVKKLIKTLGRPSRHSCERQQSLQFDEAKSLTNRKTNTEIAEVGQPTRKYASTQCCSRVLIGSRGHTNSALIV